MSVLKIFISVTSEFLTASFHLESWVLSLSVNALQVLVSKLLAIISLPLDINDVISPFFLSKVTLKSSPSIVNPSSVSVTLLNSGMSSVFNVSKSPSTPL